MPLSSPFFGQALGLLRTLPPIPQALAVAYLRVTLDKTRFTSHVIFLRGCVHRKIIPSGFRLQFSPQATPHLSRSTARILHNTSLRLMSETLRCYYAKIETLTHRKEHLKGQMMSLTNYPTRTFIIAAVRNANHGLHSSLRITKERKLHNLQDQIPSNTSLSQPNSKLVVTIPSDLALPDEQRTVLSRGLPYCLLKPSTRPLSTAFDCQRFYRRLRLAAHFSNPSTNWDTQDPTDVRSILPREASTWTPSSGVFPALDYYIDKSNKDIAKLKPTPLRHTNLSTVEQKALQDLRQRPDIVIKSADKGGAVVVWRKDLYQEEALRQLGNTQFYESIPSATTKADNTSIRKVITDLISQGKLPQEAKQLIAKEPREPRFYMLPKIHKDNNPGRPIVSACSCPTSLISEFLDSILQPLVAALPTYVKDTNDALQLFHNFSFPPNSTNRYLFTMDVTSLYTNIPTDEGLRALTHFLPKSRFKIDPTVVVRLAELVLTMNSFAFADQHFRQTRGVAMGTKMGPSYACLFVGFVEEEIFRTYPGQLPDLLRRYIDDYAGIATCSKTELLNFIHFMSTFNPALRFTYEISDTSLPFLDIEISLDPTSNRLSTSVHYKPTDSHAYLLFQSSHPKSTRESIPYSQFLRLRRICSSDNDFQNKAEEMVNFFTTRGYSPALTRMARQRAANTSRSSALMPKDSTENEDRPILALTFHPHNLAIKNVLLRNFHLLQDDPNLGSIFPKPPLVAYKKDTCLRDLLVRSIFDANHGHNEDGGFQPGTYPCNLPKCITCPYLDPNTRFIGPTGHFSVRNRFTCRSENLVYILSCTLCSKLYVGETYRSLNDRFVEHERAARLKYNTPVGNHFREAPHEPFSHLRIAAVWTNSKGAPLRQYMESVIIEQLGTQQPRGLNLRL